MIRAIVAFVAGLVAGTYLAAWILSEDSYPQPVTVGGSTHHARWSA